MRKRDSGEFSRLAFRDLELVLTHTFDAQGTTLRPLRLRYCRPSELDLMAQRAGMRLREPLQAGHPA